MTIIILTAVAFILSIILVLVDSLLHKTTKADRIEKFLPGYNCGACGYGSCHGMATELLKNKDAYKKCRILKDPSELKKYLKIK